jgi:hypothetical protein
MDSREIVLRTLEYAGPDRVAASFPAPYWNDLVHLNYDLPGHPRPWREVRPGWRNTWRVGNTWARLDATSKGEVAAARWPIGPTWTRLALRTCQPRHFEGVRAACADAGERVFASGGCPASLQIAARWAGWISSSWRPCSCGRVGAC